VIQLDLDDARGREDADVCIIFLHHLHSSPSRRRLPHIFMSQHLYADDVRVDAEEADELRLNDVRSL
jgi:hypothetical protein